MDRTLAERAHAFADLADGGHALAAPKEAVGVPPQHGRIGRPVGGKVGIFPHVGAPVIGAEAGPDRAGQAAGDEAGKSIGDQGDAGGAGLRHGGSPNGVALRRVRLEGCQGTGLRPEPSGTAGRCHREQGLNDIVDGPLRHNVGDQGHWRVGGHLRRITGKAAQAQAHEHNLGQPDCHSTMRHETNITKGDQAAMMESIHHRTA